MSTLYRLTFSTSSVHAATRQLAGLQYGSCIRQAEGYCGIIWTRDTQPGDMSFTVNGEVPAIDPKLLGKEGNTQSGDMSYWPWVVR